MNRFRRPSTGEVETPLGKFTQKNFSRTPFDSLDESSASNDLLNEFSVHMSHFITAMLYEIHLNGQQLIWLTT